MDQPFLINKFNGLWARGPVDDTPRDHFSDCLNNTYVDGGVCMRDGLTAYLAIPNVIYTALYKPNPPFTGTNVPRILALDINGDLYDALISTVTPIYSNPLMTAFGFVNQFGRCYISPSNGLTGLENVNVQVYDGTTIRDAGGPAPTTPLTAIEGSTSGKCDPGWFILSYAFETPTGFVTRPADPFVTVGTETGTIDVTLLPLGPAGTVARWVISTKNMGDFFPNPDRAEVSPLFFVTRVDNNIDTTVTLSFFDEELVDEANYLFTQMATIPAGVGLLNYNSRLVSYGEFDDPSLVRVSEPGEPESFSETSGFLITDPTDNTGVRCCLEFRTTLHVYKQSRGYLTEDNEGEASTWQVIGFEKSIGTEPNGIADILDAKGSSSTGFVLASQGAIQFFNGVFQEPELTYKIRDLWLRVNQEYAYLMQAVNDPINKRLYFLIPLDDATANSHILYGDYRNGMTAESIKWSLWEFAAAPTSLLVYTDFTDGVPTLVTRISSLDSIANLTINTPGSDLGTAVESYFKLAPVRASYGISQFNRVRVRTQGPAVIDVTLYGEDDTISFPCAPITIGSSTPGKEYAQLANLISEQCLAKFTIDGLNEKYKVNSILIEASEYGDERPR